MTGFSSLVQYFSFAILCSSVRPRERKLYILRCAILHFINSKYNEEFLIKIFKMLTHAYTHFPIHKY